jgi:hypothetical protein
MQIQVKHHGITMKISRVVAFMLGIAVASNGLNAQGTAVVSGMVGDEAGTPVREALIVVDPDSLSLRTRSGADGRYRITVPTGRFEVRVVRLGYKPQSRTIDVTESAFELNLTLESVAIPLSTISVRVTRPGLHGQVVTRGIDLLPHEPRPLRGATIEVLNEPYSIKSGADGRFSMPQLPVGSHSVLVTLDRYATRLVPVTIPPDGGMELTFTLDSLYAEYQFREGDQMRQIGSRLRRSGTPATFVSAHELDQSAKELRDGLRFATSVLSRGIILLDKVVTVYIDGKPQNPLLQLQDIKMDDLDIQGIEVYPPNTLPTDAGVAPGIALPGGEPMFSSGKPAEGSFSSRTTVRSRGNQEWLVMIWTSRRR